MWTQLKPVCEPLYTKLVCSVNGAYDSRVVRLFMFHVVLLEHFIRQPGIIVPIIVIIITAIVFG